MQCEELQEKKELFDGVQKLLNIQLTQYHELQHTQEVIQYLLQLYLYIIYYRNCYILEHCIVTIRTLLLLMKHFVIPCGVK